MAGLRLVLVVVVEDMAAGPDRGVLSKAPDGAGSCWLARSLESWREISGAGADRGSGLQDRISQLKVVGNVGMNMRDRKLQASCINP